MIRKVLRRLGRSSINPPVLSAPPWRRKARTCGSWFSNPAKRSERPPSQESKPPELPRIVRLIALARECQALIDRGEIRSRAESELDEHDCRGEDAARG